MIAQISDEEAEDYRNTFPIFRDKIYLNSCSLGPLSEASRAALLDYADDWESYGAPAWWLKWMPKIDEICTLFAGVINAGRESVTIHHSVSSALSSIASSLDYTHRNKVVVSEIDFPTISYQWLVKAGVEVVFARSLDGVTVPVDEYQRLVDERTAAIATSHVFYATGAVQDVDAIADVAHKCGAMCIIDGYHAVGVLPVDVQKSKVDFYVGGTLKWVCGGPGLTFIYAAPGVVQTATPGITGWFAAENQFSFDTKEFTPATTAARFQLGTPAVATVYTGIPALKTILKVGPNRIYDRLQLLTSRIIARAQREGFEIASPLENSKRGGVVMLRVPEPEKAVQVLSDQSIVVDARPGKVRVSPHFFNTEADVDRVIDALDGVYSEALA